MATALRDPFGIEYELESSDSEASVSSMPSGYGYEFPSTPPEELTCSICLCVFRDPHLTSCCGNHFCEACIKRITSKKGPCPLCKQRKFVIMLDKSICRKVNQLRVKCPNRGCTWIGELGSVEKHFNKQTGTCQFMFVQCDLKCGAKLSRKQLEDHKTKHCPMRQFSCKYCKLTADCKTIQGTHLSVCPKFPVSCPNHCTKLTIQRQNLASHLSERCPLAKESCYYEFAGCTKKINRKDADQHETDCALEHLQLVTDAYLTLKSRSSKQDKEIEQLKQEYHRRR